MDCSCSQGESKEPADFLLLSPPQAVSIADREVFAFQMVNYTDATYGDAYLDMSNVDTSVTLTVGCIQVVFLNKFVSSVLVRLTNLFCMKNLYLFRCCFSFFFWIVNYLVFSSPRPS